MFICIAHAICTSYFLEVIQYPCISPVELDDNICRLCSELPKVLVFGAPSHLSKCLSWKCKFHIFFVSLKDSRLLLSSLRMLLLSLASFFNLTLVDSAYCHLPFGAHPCFSYTSPCRFSLLYLRLFWAHTCSSVASFISTKQWYSLCP